MIFFLIWVVKGFFVLGLFKLVIVIIVWLNKLIILGKVFLKKLEIFKVIFIWGFFNIEIGKILKLIIFWEGLF